MLATLERSLDPSDELVARTLLCGCKALETFLAQRGGDADEILHLEELRVFAHIARGEDIAAAELAYPLSGALRVQGEFLRAEVVLQRSFEALRPGAAMRPRLLLALAELDRHFLRHEQALIRLDEAHAELVAGPELDVLKRAFGGLKAQVQLDLGLVDLAAPWIEQEVEDLRARRAAGEDVSDSLPTALLRVANLRLASGQYDLQVVEIERALADLDDLAERDGRIAFTRERLELHLNFARLEAAAVKPGDVTTALRRLEAVEGSETADPGTRLECAGRLGQWALRAGDLDEAQAWLGRARAVVDARGAAGEELDLKSRSFLAAIETRLSILRGDEREIQEQRLGRLSDMFGRLLDRLLEQPPRAAGLGFLRYDRTRTILGELMAGQAALADSGGGAARALKTLHLASEAGSLHRLLGAKPVDLAAVTSKLLPQGTGALVYFPFRDRSLLFTVDAAHGVEIHVLPGERLLEPVARAWKSDVLTSPYGLPAGLLEARKARIERVGAELSRLLFPPATLERMRSWSSVLIAGSDLLGELPFEALPFAGGEPLGLAKAIGYLPSLPVGVHLFDRALARSEADVTDLCLLADVRSDSAAGGPDPLPFAADDLEAMLAPFPRDRIKTLLGERAILSELRLQDLAHTAVLHIVTHGAHDAARERPQGLALSAGETLWCEQAEVWTTGPRMVVLSACGAGSGPKREGDGPVANLGGAFLRGGADCVVLSEADLAYRPTLMLISAFQRELAQGVAPGEAMRRARLRVKRSEGWNDPFYYALVRVLGLSDRSVF